MTAKETQYHFLKKRAFYFPPIEDQLSLQERAKTSHRLCIWAESWQALATKTKVKTNNMDMNSITCSLIKKE